ELGKWVRLEVPAAAVGLENKTVSGAAFTLIDGQAWFDRSGRIPRANVALNKTAKQSTSDSTKPAEAASSAVDGSMTNYQATKSEAQPWWEVDLGASYPVETISVTNRSDAFQSRLTDFWVLVSDEPIASTSLNTAKTQAGVSAMRHGFSGGTRSEFAVNRTARYVRVQLEGTDILNMAEVQVWAPATPSRVNLAIGATASQSSTSASHASAIQALDGILNDNYTHTNFDARAYWQADLGKVQPISTISLFKRDQCCYERMANFYVFVSDAAFASTDPAATLAQAGVSAWYYANAPVALDVAVNRTGRYVRVQLTGTNYLHLGEVQVWGQQNELRPMAHPEDSPPDR
nr:discoidin domain-containing protein [Acidobacteriota bacterium]